MKDCTIKVISWGEKKIVLFNLLFLYLNWKSTIYSHDDMCGVYLSVFSIIKIISVCYAKSVATAKREKRENENNL